MNIGTFEIIVICVVALLVLGPEKTPYYAKKVGKAMQDVKRYSKQWSDEFNDVIIEPLEEMKQPLKNASDDLMKPVQESLETMDSILK